MVMRMIMMIKYSLQVVRFAVYVYFTLSLIASQEVSRDPYTFVPIFLILKVGMTIIMSMMMRMMMLTIVMMMMMMRFQGAPTPLSSSWEDDLAHLKVFDGAQYPLSPPRDTHSNAQRAFLFQSSYELISPLYHSDDSYWLKTLSMHGLINLIIMIFVIIIIIIIIDYQSTKDVEHAWTSFNERPPATQQVHTLHLQRSFDVNVNLWLFML